MGDARYMKLIPRLNGSYWALMLVCTTMGELIGNLLSRNFELGYTQGALMDLCIFSATVFIIMFFKLKNDIYYWILILIGNIGGTNLADWVTLDPLENDRKWGILKPLQLGTHAGSLVVLGTLSLVLVIRYLFTKKYGDESSGGVVFYWIAILLSSTFGTTSGDFITNDTPFGAFGGSLLLLVLLAIVYGAFKMGRVNKMTAYWLALVLMHPVGATIGNYVSKPIGLNFGNVYTNVALIIMFSAIYFNDLKNKPADAPVFSNENV
jgi:uncharacterized membrane-anchored protein